MADSIDGIPLGKKVGPFPIAGWVAIAVVGVGGGYFVSKRLKGSSTTTAAQDANLAAADAANAGGVSASGLNMGSAPGGSTIDLTGAAAVTTNLAWGNEATVYLVSTGADAFAASQAVGAYLSGQQLAPGQQTMISSAISKLGPPPEGAPVQLASPQPTDTTTTQTPSSSSTVPPSNPAVAAGNVSSFPIPTPPAGETIVGVAYTSSGHGAWYLTQLGGVYTVGDAPFHGSYPGLPAAGKQGGPRTFGLIEADPGDHYTLIDTAGERYSF